MVHHGRNFRLINRCLRLIYSFHSIAESFIRRRSENYLCALEFELCVAFLRDLRLIPRQCPALVAREQLYTQLSQIAGPGTISDVHWTMHHIIVRVFCTQYTSVFVCAHIFEPKTDICQSSP